MNIDEHVYLKLKKIISSLSLGICKKLAPRFCRPFEILVKRGTMAYELALPSQIKVYNIFHASLLKKYVYDTKQVIDWSLLQVEPKGDFISEPLYIMDKREVKLKKRIIVQLKVQWKRFGADEATLENEATMKEAYLTLFHYIISSPQNIGMVLF